MSAIATPLIHSTNVLSGQSDLVNVETCRSVTTVDSPVATGVNGKAKYLIVFHHDENGSGTPGQTVWSYVDGATRDADFALLLAAASTAL